MSNVTVWTKSKEDGEVNGIDMGGYSKATEDLLSVSVHGVTDIKRKTRTIKSSDGEDFKVCTITLVTAEGRNIEIDTFLA